MAEGDGLLNRCTALKPYRGFESLRLRFSFVDNQQLVKVVFENLKDLKLFFTKLGFGDPKIRPFLLHLRVFFMVHEAGTDHVDRLDERL